MPASPSAAAPTSTQMSAGVSAYLDAFQGAHAADPFLTYYAVAANGCTQAVRVGRTPALDQLHPLPPKLPGTADTPCSERSLNTFRASVF